MLSLLNVCRFYIVTTNDELRLDRELLRSESESLLGHCERDALTLDEHHAGLDGSDEAGGVTLTLTHSDVGRLAGYWLVGEDTDPDLTLTLHIARDSDTSRLDLARRDPKRRHCLDSERTERKLGAAVRDAVVLAATILRPPILDSLRL